jgi:glycerol uptake facilitator-like aquaporin
MIKPIIEFIGTFIFFSVILQHGQAIPIAIALAAVIYFGGSTSGGHFNPGVSLMMFLKGSLTSSDMIQYVAVQCMAAYAAVLFNKYLNIPK